MYLGGYQIIDCTGITLTSSPLTVVNSEMADIIRESDKLLVFTNVTSETGAKATVPSVQVLDIGSKDGKIVTTVIFTVSTDDDRVTFTPMG